MGPTETLLTLASQVSNFAAIRVFFTMNSFNNPQTALRSNSRSFSTGRIVNEPVKSDADADTSDEEEFEQLSPERPEKTASHLNSRTPPTSFTVKSTSIKVPLKDGQDTRRPTTPYSSRDITTSFSAQKNGVSTAEIDREDTLIREQVLISDDNTFTPNHKARSQLLKSTNGPERLQSANGSERNVYTKSPFAKSFSKSSISRGPVTKSPNYAKIPGPKQDGDGPKSQDVDVSSSDIQDEKFSTKPHVDDFTVRSASPKLYKGDGLIGSNNDPNLPLSVESYSVVTGIDKRSLQVGTSGIGVDLTLSQAPKPSDSQEQGNFFDPELSFDEHEVSLDENADILNDMNAFSASKLSSPARALGKTSVRIGPVRMAPVGSKMGPVASKIGNASSKITPRTTSPRTTPRKRSRIHSPTGSLSSMYRASRARKEMTPEASLESRFKATKVPKPEMTPIGKHYDRLKQTFEKDFINNNRKKSPVKVSKQSELDKPWPEEKWEKLNSLVESPNLTVDDILDSPTVQNILDISESDLKERVNFLLHIKTMGKKRRKLL